MESTAVATVTGMTCGHCVAAVRDEIATVTGVTDVDVDLDRGTATIHSSGPVQESAVKAAVEEAGYELVDFRTS